jgi:hypothetical protein
MLVDDQAFPLVTRSGYTRRGETWGGSLRRLG